MEHLRTELPISGAQPAPVSRRRRAAVRTAVLTGALLLAASPVLAATSGGGGSMPWEGPLNQLLASMTGPVARVIGAVAIIGMGIAVAFSEGGSLLRRGLWLVLGLTIAFNALTWGLSFMGFSGGLTV